MIEREREMRFKERVIFVLRCDVCVRALWGFLIATSDRALYRYITLN